MGELHAVLKRRLANTPVIDLMHDAPAFNPKASCYLLAALARQFQAGDVCLAVVDPGVGMPQRRVLLIEADGIAYCGPDNGLFCRIVKCAQQVHCYEITWRPADMSESFHGRDLFAPALTQYILKSDIAMQLLPVDALVGINWPEDLPQVIYFDRFGNAVTGIRGNTVTSDARLQANTRELGYARTFATVAAGEPFWYVNSMGMVELAINQASIREELSLLIGSPVEVVL